MDRLPSCPDLVLLEGTEQGPGGRIYGINKDARLHLVKVTFTTDFALVDRVASETAQHERLCGCLADAGWSNVKLHLFIVGHTGVMGWGNAQALLGLEVPPSQVQPALEAIAIMGCRYSCKMLKAYWCGPADISVPSPDAPNLTAVHLQNLLSGTARRSPPCLLHKAAAGGHPLTFPVRPLGGQPSRSPPSMVLLGSASDHLTVLLPPSLHACMPTLFLPYPMLPLHLHLTYQ